MLSSSENESSHGSLDETAELSLVGYRNSRIGGASLEDWINI
jgi:hypothetical protein